MNDKTKEAIKTAKTQLDYLVGISPHLDRIVDLVRQNPEFFDVKLGTCTVKCAADKLESLVNQAKR